VPTVFVFHLFTPIFLKSVQLKIIQPPWSRYSFFSFPSPGLSSSNLVPLVYLGKYSIHFYTCTLTNSGVTQLHLSVMALQVSLHMFKMPLFILNRQIHKGTQCFNTRVFTALLHTFNLTSKCVLHFLPKCLHKSFCTYCESSGLDECQKCVYSFFPYSKRLSNLNKQWHILTLFHEVSCFELLKICTVILTLFCAYVQAGWF